MRETFKRRIVRAVFMYATAGIFGATALAQDGTYPNKPIRLIVPYGVGGNADTVSRIVGPKLGEALGQQIIIDNRPGASGNIGAEIAAQAPADGYTLVILTNTHASSMSLFTHARFNLAKDFAPVSLLGSTPLLLVVTPALQVSSVADLIALARARPGELNYASGGSGSSGHLTMELFKSMAGIKLVHVTYRGASAGLNDVMAGRIQAMFSSVPSLLPQVKSGRLKALAVTSLKRSAAMPQLPTVAESGLSGFEASLWDAVAARAGSPKSVVARLHGELIGVMKSTEVTRLLSRQGFDIATSSPQELANYIKSEIAKWEKVVKASGARID